MEDAVEAFKMAFSMLVFVIALSIAMFAFNSANATAQVLVYVTDKSNYYSNLQLDGTDVDDPTKAGYNASYRQTRIVSPDTVIPTLYRYYKENFSVRFYDPSGNMLQLFDINTEGKVYVAASKTHPDEAEQLLLGLYNDPVGSPNMYLFEAPWIGDTAKHVKTRIDMFIKGESGFINNVFVDYSHGNNLKNYLAQKSITAADGSNTTVNEYIFEETFVKYTFIGDTISVGEGEEIETLTGTKQPEEKIDIIYRICQNDRY